MRTLRLFEHITLDGVIQLPGPDEDPAYAHGDWTAPFRSPAGAEIVAAALGDAFDLLLGRRTYFGKRRPARVRLRAFAGHADRRADKYLPPRWPAASRRVKIRFVGRPSRLPRDGAFTGGNRDGRPTNAFDGSPFCAKSSVVGATRPGSAQKRPSSTQLKAIWR